MKTMIVELSFDDEAMLLGFCRSCALIENRPEKFDLADKAFEQIVLRQPLDAKTCTGLLDSIGGYCSATQKGVELGISTKAALDDALELIKIATKIHNQATRHGLFELTIVKNEGGSDV